MNYIRLFFIIFFIYISIPCLNAQVANESNKKEAGLMPFITLYHQHHDFFGKAFSFQGLEIGLIAQQKLFFGIYGAFFISNLKITLNNETRFLWIGQSGVNVSYVLFYENRFHPGAQLNLGYFTLRHDAEDLGFFETDKAEYKLNGIVISPQLFGEFVVADWFQIRTGLSYNFYNYNDHSSIETSNLNHISFTFGMVFKLNNL